VLGQVRMQNVIPRFRRAPGRVRFPGRSAIGADTRSVMAGLGYDDEAIERLLATGVIRAG
jgi:crotonobetainyl-CoA:carnitine CoA-transferase CaiB-like acyl-CoA transferase